jgi:hypothetical protein
MVFWKDEAEFWTIRQEYDFPYDSELVLEAQQIQADVFLEEVWIHFKPPIVDLPKVYSPAQKHKIQFEAQQPMVQGMAKSLLNTIEGYQDSGMTSLTSRADGQFSYLFPKLFFGPGNGEWLFSSFGPIGFQLGSRFSAGADYLRTGGLGGGYMPYVVMVNHKTHPNGYHRNVMFRFHKIETQGTTHVNIADKVEQANIFSEKAKRNLIGELEGISKVDYLEWLKKAYSRKDL